MSLRSAKVLSCVVGRRGQKDRGGVHCWHLPLCVRYTHCCAGFLYRRWWLGIANVFILSYHAEVISLLIRMGTSYILCFSNPCQPTRFDVVSWWHLGSLFRLCNPCVPSSAWHFDPVPDIVCCVFSSSSTLCSSLFSAVLLLFCLLCGLNAVDERDGLGSARETGQVFRGYFPLGF